MISLAPFSKSPLRSPNSKVSAFSMRFHRFGVNGRLNWSEKYSFLTKNVYMLMPPKAHVDTCTFNPLVSDQQPVLCYASSFYSMWEIMLPSLNSSMGKALI